MNFLDIHLVNQVHIPARDISVITHLDEKFLEIDDLETLDELAGIRVTLPDNSSDSSSYAILNADDDLVYELRDELCCKIALFSIYPENRRIKRHCRRGGLAAIVENNCLVLCKGERKIPLLSLPLHLGDKSKVLASELLPYILAAKIHKFPVQQISRTLRQLLSLQQSGVVGNPIFTEC